MVFLEFTGDKYMFKGIVFALSACFIWGLIFVVPQFMVGFSSIEVVLGRYFLYGTISLMFFLSEKLRGKCSYAKGIWKKALFFSLISTVGYYTFLVMALRCAPPAICALTLGISPITIALYGNWKQKDISFKSLIFPSLLILLGLIVINIPNLQISISSASYGLGLLFSLISLGAWSWYAVANSQFLRENPKIHSGDWATLIGVSTLFWVFLVFLGVFLSGQLQVEKYATFNADLMSFLVGSAALGFLCSWLGTFLWNRASGLLPVSLAGQLTVFETIFGVLFVYTVNKSMPSILESIGMTILCVAVVLGIQKFTKKEMAL